MYCKIVREVTKTIADVLQDLNRRHKDNRRCIARSFEKSQRQSPMYCKFSTDVTKTIADEKTARFYSVCHNADEKHFALELKRSIADRSPSQTTVSPSVLPNMKRRRVESKSSSTNSRVCLLQNNTTKACGCR